MNETTTPAITFDGVRYGFMRMRNVRCPSARPTVRSTGTRVSSTRATSSGTSWASKRAAKSESGRPTSPSASRNTAVAAGVKRAIRDSRSRKMVAIWVLWKRFWSSPWRRSSSSTFLLSSVLRVLSASLEDCSSSFSAWSCAWDLRSASFAFSSSSTVAWSRRWAPSRSRWSCGWCARSGCSRRPMLRERSKALFASAKRWTGSGRCSASSCSRICIASEWTSSPEEQPGTQIRTPPRRRRSRTSGITTCSSVREGSPSRKKLVTLIATSS